MVTNNELELLRDTINKFPGSVNSRNWKSQSTSFHLAADAGRPEIIRDLINARAELDCRDCFQSTALIRCFVPFEQSVSHKFDLTTPRKVRKHSRGCPFLFYRNGKTDFLSPKLLFFVRKY